jgi:hypothetical protein
MTECCSATSGQASTVANHAIANELVTVGFLEVHDGNRLGQIGWSCSRFFFLSASTDNGQLILEDG